MVLYLRQKQNNLLLRSALLVQGGDVDQCKGLVNWVNFIAPT